MKLIQPKAELLPWTPGVEGVYKMIELAGRTCYKSTDKITEDSAKPFVDRMIASHHTAMLEHGTVYLKFDNEQTEEGYHGMMAIERYKHNPYSRVSYSFKEGGEHEFAACMYVTTNLRVLVENNWLDDLKYLCDPTEFHEMRYSFKLTTSIGVTRELNRHRVNSIAEQSTRYCNYSKYKFGNEVKFCIPEWCHSLQEDVLSYSPFEITSEKAMFMDSIFRAEKGYMSLLDKGWSPQQAREVLPLCTATEIVHTAFASDWRHFFDLRYFGKTGNPHPNMLQLVTLMKEEAEKQGIWNDIMSKPSKF